MSKFRQILSPLLIVQLLTTPVFAADSFNQNFDYPELNVAPLASERLKWEAEEEKGRGIFSLLPLQAPALVTLTAGILQISDRDKQNDPYGASPATGIVVGGTWLVATLALGALYTPYQDGYDKIKNIPTRTKRERLMKERLAEESLYAPSSLISKIKYFQIATNLGASLMMLSRSRGGTLGESAAILAAGFSFLPLVFTPHWNSVANKHREYKKKIYSPVASTTFFLDQTNSLVPGMALSFVF